MTGEQEEQTEDEHFEPLAPTSSAPPAVTVYNLCPDLDADCDKQWQRLAATFLSQPEDAATEVPEKAMGPLHQVLHVARLNGCRTVLVEERYLDPDYRSEFAAFWSKRFEKREPTAKRLHFFTNEFSADDAHKLPKDHGYLGYSVLRPTPLGPVGRTVLKRPSPELDGAVLTQVHDRPSLFGNTLEVVGVPFLQQDGELVVCAHTAAWLCHYVAQDRKIIGRRTTAEIVGMPSVEGSHHRPVPSNGLTSEQMQGIFSALNIPAFFAEIKNLAELPAKLPDDQAADEAGVLREQILRVACKYINSGFPVVVLTEKGHAFTLVGWQKKDDKIRLIACDDQYGPYEVIDDPLDPPEHREGQWKSFMIPLPEKVFLTGEAAEVGARSAVLLTVDQYRKNGIELAHGDDLAKIAAHLDDLRGPISVRARLVEGRHYKAMLEQQERSEAPLRLLRLAHLPHWVWLIEFHDREARDDDKPCVLAELVMDSTSHDDLPVADLSATRSLAVDLGRARANPADEGATAEADGSCWRSLIADRRLIDEEFLGGSGDKPGVGEQGKAA